MNQGDLFFLVSTLQFTHECVQYSKWSIFPYSFTNWGRSNAEHWVDIRKVRKLKKLLGEKYICMLFYWGKHLKNWIAYEIPRSWKMSDEFRKCVNLSFQIMSTQWVDNCEIELWLRKFCIKILAGIYKKQTRQLEKPEAAGNQRCKDRNNFWIFQIFKQLFFENRL